MADLVHSMLVVKTRLWDLAMEQEDKGNSAMHFVLSDLCEQTDNIRREIEKLIQGSSDSGGAKER